MSRVDTAGQLFTDGKSCSQAVFAAFAPSLGVDEAQALRLASGFGGGMHIGATCGAATGAVLALGLRYAGDDSGTDRHAVMAAVETFFERFADRVGAIDCPAILGCDIRTEEGQATSREQGLRESRCLPAVRAAASILEEML
ncbi:MAG: C-GCAxxG-C-C family protein [Coriobacteriia bacterium]